MFYAVLTRNGSLREVCENISFIAQKLIPFGFKQLPARSTLSDANQNRSYIFFQELLRLYALYRTRLKGNWLEIGGEVDPQEVEVFDSTTITLFKAVLKGAGRKPLEGEKKGLESRFLPKPIWQKVFQTSSVSVRRQRMRIYL